MTKLAKIFIFFCFFLPLTVQAQKVRYSISPINAESALKEENIRAQVAWLTHPDNGGRATGTEGARNTAVWLSERFREAGLEPLSGAWLHGFNTSAGMGRNVIGFIPGSAWPTRYVIVMAHYDNLGILGGTFYPGADANASGTTALLQLAAMFQQMRACRKVYSSGLILVALDAKEKNQAGAEDLWRLIDQHKLLDPVSGNPIHADQISLVVNLDQLGATLSPITKGHPDYLLMLSEAANGHRATLESENTTRHIGLELGFDYYGSKDFTNLFYRRVSDQRVFLEHDIPAVMFTSGITFNNNKPHDDAASLDYGILRKRIQLIFYYLDRVL